MQYHWYWHHPLYRSIACIHQSIEFIVFIHPNIYPWYSSIHPLHLSIHPSHSSTTCSWIADHLWDDHEGHECLHGRLPVEVLGGDAVEEEEATTVIVEVVVEVVAVVEVVGGGEALVSELQSCVESLMHYWDDDNKVPLCMNPCSTHEECGSRLGTSGHSSVVTFRTTAGYNCSGPCMSTLMDTHWLILS